MKLSIVIPVLGQHELSKLCLSKIIDKQIHDTENEIVIIDNGGDFSVESSDLPDKFARFTVLRPPEGNIGVYPAFKFGMENTTGDVVLFIHSDLIIDELGFDVRLLDAFEKDPKLGLVGFIGSAEIDFNGGRGGYTTSNFQGGTYVYKGKVWKGSPARDHGMRSKDLSKAAVVDGCSMALSRNAYNSIEYREDFPPHHFYDRLISMQVIEAGFDVAVLGIACDHISGQTANTEERYPSMAADWFKKHNISPVNPQSMDQSIYVIAERMFLDEYRESKKMIPRKV